MTINCNSSSVAYRFPCTIEFWHEIRQLSVALAFERHDHAHRPSTQYRTRDRDPFQSTLLGSTSHLFGAQRALDHPISIRNAVLHHISLRFHEFIHNYVAQIHEIVESFLQHVLHIHFIYGSWISSWSSRD